MALLYLWFNREPSDVLSDNFYDLLENEIKPPLSDAEFVAACREIRLSARSFPSPRDIEAAIRPTGEEIATLEWHAIISFWQLPESDRTQLNLSPEGEAAYKLLGGRRLADGNLHDTRVLREFIKMRSAFAKQATAKAFALGAAAQTKTLPAAAQTLPHATQPQIIKQSLPTAAAEKSLHKPLRAKS